MFCYKVPKLNLRLCPSKATFCDIQMLNILIKLVFLVKQSTQINLQLLSCYVV